MFIHGQQSNIAGVLWSHGCRWVQHFNSGKIIIYCVIKKLKFRILDIHEFFDLNTKMLCLCLLVTYSSKIIVKGQLFICSIFILCQNKKKSTCLIWTQELFGHIDRIASLFILCIRNHQVEFEFHTTKLMIRSIHNGSMGEQTLII